MDMNKITYLHSEPIVYNRGKNGIFRDSGHISGPTLRLKRKTKNKRMFLSRAVMF